jgi:hypothetical protein
MEMIRARIANPFATVGMDRLEIHAFTKPKSARAAGGVNLHAPSR